MELSRDQREAVEHGEGPLLIVAGAGTGKTTVITRRIAHLITSKKARPEEVLALTFTDKAAQEMEERVDLLIPYGYADITISTFHAFGDRVLRDNALDMGMRPDFRVMTLPEQIIFFREHLFEFELEYYRPLSDPTRHIDALLRAFSRARDEDVTPEEYLAHVEALSSRKVCELGDGEMQEIVFQQRDVARAYHKYQELKMRHNLIDFGDQVSLSLGLFRRHPRILRRYQDRFRWVLVDEFQDTNYAQFQLLKLLTGRHTNITVVGDDDQAIYKWRGAAISNIMGFLDVYSGAKKVVLRDNYRSPQEVLDSAYRLITFNNPERLEAKYGIDKRLRATNGKGSPPGFLLHDTVSTEADQVTAIIAEQKERGRKYGDFAILVRDNRDADPFLRSLNMRGIPWRFSGNRGLYTQEEVRVLISFLFIIADPHDSRHLYFLSGSDIYGLDARDVAVCANAASRKNLSLYTVFKDILPQVDLDVSPEGQAVIARVLEDVRSYMAMAQSLSTGQVLYKFLVDKGFLKKLTDAKSQAAVTQVQNISKFFEVVRAFESLSPHDRAAQFVRHLDMLMEAGDDPATAEAEPDENAVNVLTVHKAKGLEFPVVFMVGLVTQNFPTRKRGDPIELPAELVKEPVPSGDVHIREERRLFYVGMTRAKEELYLTAARDYGGKRLRKVSPFVLEALDIPRVDGPVRKTAAVEAIRRSAPPDRTAETSPAYLSPDDPLQISFYQIDDYTTCPLKYRFVHVLRVPILSHHTVVFGKALHDAVQEYHRRKMSGRGVTIEDVLEVYKGSWRSEGFISREHEQMRFSAGEKALRDFFAAQEASGVLPTYVEKEFSFRVDGNILKGRWDRVDVRSEGVSITDYKSSEVRDQGEADKKTRESDQLSIYALAYRTIYGKVPDTVHLYFLGSGLVGTARKTDRDMEKTLDLIRRAASGIRSRSYDPTPGWHCRFCAYVMICDWAMR